MSEYEEGRAAGRLRGAELFDWAFAEVERDEIATSKAMGNSAEYIAGLRRGLKEAFEVAQLAVIKEFDLKEFNIG